MPAVGLGTCMSFVCVPHMFQSEQYSMRRRACGMIVLMLRKQRTQQSDLTLLHVQTRACLPLGSHGVTAALSCSAHTASTATRSIDPAGSIDHSAGTAAPASDPGGNGTSGAARGRQLVAEAYARPSYVGQHGSTAASSSSPPPLPATSSPSAAAGCALSRPVNAGGSGGTRQRIAAWQRCSHA